jgi:hypothetical protein
LEKKQDLFLQINQKIDNKIIYISINSKK